MLCECVYVAVKTMVNWNLNLTSLYFRFKMIYFAIHHDKKKRGGDNEVNQSSFQPQPSF